MALEPPLLLCVQLKVIIPGATDVCSLLRDAVNAIHTAVLHFSGIHPLVG